MIPPDREETERHRERHEQNHPEPEVRHRVRRRMLRARSSRSRPSSATPGGDDPDEDRRRPWRAPSRRRRARSSATPVSRCPRRTGRFVEYERPKLSCAVCWRYRQKLLALRTCRARTPGAARAAARSSAASPAKRFATGSDSTTRKRKKLKTDDERERRERGEDLPGDEPEAHSPAATRSPVRYSRSSAVLRRRTK